MSSRNTQTDGVSTDYTLCTDDIKARWPKMAERASNGAFTAAIRLKCLDCCAGQAIEVRRCTLVDCPLHPYRMGRFAGKDPDYPGLPEDGDET